MVHTQLEERGIKEPSVLKAMSEVPRHKFVPVPFIDSAYDDMPLSIGYNQTISQPYMVAYLAKAAHVAPNATVLEIGTGCGYQAAVLSRLCGQVYTIEIVSPLAVKARKLLRELKYDNIEIKIGDGYKGWQEKAPFDVIILTAAPKYIPEEISAQLKMYGRIIMPIHEDFIQKLIRLEKTPEGLKREDLSFVRFVPMVHENSE